MPEQESASTNKWGLSKKTNLGLAAITTIGLVSTSAVSEWWIRLAGIVCITGLAGFGILMQHHQDMERYIK